MIRNVSALLVLLVCGLVITADGHADEKYYVWTYDYSSLAKGSAEIEYYLTTTTRDRQTSSQTDWQHQVELEYGLTDHLDVALYQVFEQPAGGAFHYGGFKARVRYRVAEKDELPIDVVLYAEHEEATDGDNAFEGKVILAKDLGKINLAYNQIYERKYNSGKGEHEYAAGVSYEVEPSVRFGLESKGSFTEGEYSAGPTLAWSGGRIWANIGALYGFNRKTSDRQIRFLLGLPF